MSERGYGLQIQQQNRLCEALQYFISTKAELTDVDLHNAIIHTAMKNYVIMLQHTLVLLIFCIGIYCELIKSSV